MASDKKGILSGQNLVVKVISLSRAHPFCYPELEYSQSDHADIYWFGIYTDCIYFCSSLVA